MFQVNLSPALSNDCDADRSVKKPMLHDMFDLLGLPLYNTGLSVFDIFLDESNENDKYVFPKPRTRFN
jgi:tubulin polyglutamylase TTLL2